MIVDLYMGDRTETCRNWEVLGETEVTSEIRKRMYGVTVAFCDGVERHY